MKKGLLATISLLAGAAVGVTAMDKMRKQTIETKEEKVDKFKGYYNMLNQWLVLKQEGGSLEKYFLNQGYKTIAIYGMGEMGARLYDELKNSSNVEIKCAIDKNKIGIYSEIEVFELEDDLPKVDVIVVTPTFAFDAIKESLSEKVDCPIVSLDDVVYEA